MQCVATLSIIALACFLISKSLHAQGVSYPGTPIALTRGGFPAAGATVTVCTGVVTVTLANSPPCAPYATIYSDSGLTLPITQPGFKTDGLGNYPFFVASGGGAFTIVLTGNGFTGQSTVWVAPIIGTLPNLFSALQTFDAALAIKEIAAPSGLANYEVLYGNTATHRLVVKLNNAAEDAIVTDAGAATLTSKTTTNLVTNGTMTGTGIQTLITKSGSGSGNYITASQCTTYADVDAANLSYTVTIPTGWKLNIATSADVAQNTAAASETFQIFDTQGSVVVATRLTNPAVGASGGLAMGGTVNGDGNSHTLKMRYCTAVAADTALIRNINTDIPTMTFLLSPSN